MVRRKAALLPGCLLAFLLIPVLLVFSKAAAAQADGGALPPEAGGTGSPGDTVSGAQTGPVAGEEPKYGESGSNEGGTSPLAEPEKPGRQESSAPDESSEAEQVVFTYEDMKKALEDETTTLIRLGGDIRMEGGVGVNASKPELVIDGEDPGNPGAVHTLTEFYSAGSGDAISLPAGAALRHVTLRNLNIQGYNHYGTVYVPDSLRGVTILYQNITYHGPQLCFNRYGTAHLDNAAVYIDGRNTPAAPGEVGEVSSAILEGRVHLEQLQNNDNEIFWVELSSGAITVSPGADVTVKTFAAAGFVFVNGSRQAPLTIGEGASFRFTGKNRFWDGSFLSGLTIEPGGELYVDITGSLDNEGIVAVRGDVAVGEDAVMHLRILGTGAGAALRVQGGSISITDPRSVLLYAPGGRCIHYDSENTLYLEAQQINYWTAAPVMALDNRPLYGWAKADGTNFYLSGTMNLGRWTSLASNFEEGDSPGTAPGAENASMVNARLLALGRSEVTAWYDRLSDTHAVIRGITGHPQSLARASLLEGESGASLGDVASTGDSLRFDIPLDVLLPFGARVTVETVGHYLWAETSFTVAPSSLYLSHQAQFLPFPPTALSAVPQIIYRTDPDWSLTVHDARPPGRSWRLWATVPAPLNPVESRYPPLEGALVFVDGAGGVRDLSSDTLIAQGVSRQGVVETAVGWPYNQGILILLPPGAAYADIPYTATIVWRLEDVP